jgi:hypothetical protein
MKFWNLSNLLLAALTASVLSCSGQGYQSPYTVVFSVPPQELYAIDQQEPRNDPRMESSIPFQDWYSKRVRKEFGAWGPDPRHYPPIQGFENIPASWKRQRVLAVGYRMIGLPYQHHHVPDWDPPTDWPWKQVAYGRNSKGMDCSDFTAWMYNYGLGLHLSTGVVKQANTTDLRGPGDEGAIQAKVIRDENGYDDLVSKLKTGDLLYIKNDKGDIGHVIMWVGEHGRSPDGSPLVIDCTGPDHKDCYGNTIPIGVQLRPFLRDSWYYKSFSHAHRIIGEPLLSGNN